MHDRILPHCLDSETHLIEACFCPGGIDKVVDQIAPNDFYSEGGKQIFAKLMEFHRSGCGFTPALIDQAFLGHPHYEGIRRVLDTLVPITAETAAHFGEIVKQLSLRRQAIQEAYGIYESLHDPSIPLERFADLIPNQAVGFITSGAQND